ncbi:PREDICTED: heat shock transcription factor, X-linked-like, partial [Leptosomus discolor]|uniref:heat shock transcription factor, X-linked-like n=1 Tax=Leptosomus discolor TaxID=188344 RepID=UPI0005224BCE
MPTAKHHFGLTLTGEFERELSPGEISASALDEFAESADSTSPVLRVPCEADLVPIKEEMHFQACCEDHKTKRVHPISAEKSSGEADDFASLTFPKKLWRIVQSHHFQSIWWVDDGICVAIDKEGFQKE